MAITSDGNLTFNVSQLEYTTTINLSGDSDGPYFVQVVINVPVNTTSATFFDTVVHSFATALNGLTGITVGSTIQKSYSGGILGGPNAFNSNSITV